MFYKRFSLAQKPCLYPYFLRVQYAPVTPANFQILLEPLHMLFHLYVSFSELAFLITLSG